MAWHPNGKWLAVGYFMRDEVEVWDIEAKKPLFAVPSQRRPINRSGQEVLFSKDGKYLVVQDFLDTRNGEPKFPSNLRGPEEIEARLDKERYVLARVWDVDRHQEVAQLKGPGSIVYGAVQNGMCLMGGQADQLVMHRKAWVSIYSTVTGEALSEMDVSHPFSERPEQTRGYWRMACHPTRAEVALEGAQFFGEAPLFGFTANSGATPIVIVDLKRLAIKKVLFSATPLNGVAYTADGSKLISYGAPPIRVWDANADFALVGEITQPPENTGDFVAVPGYDGVLGIATDMHLWNTKKLESVQVLPMPRDIFRISLHSGSGAYAIASRNSLFIARLSRENLERLTKKD